MKKISFTLMLLFAVTSLFASAPVQPSDESVFYSDGKIYVVVACVAVILLGVLIYLFTLDRRLKKLEKKS